MKNSMISLAAACAVALAAGSWSSTPAAQSRQGVTASAAALKQDMRKLWTGHVVWTRDYIVAAVGDQADAQAAGQSVDEEPGRHRQRHRDILRGVGGPATDDAPEAAHLDRRRFDQSREGRRQGGPATSRWQR